MDKLKQYLPYILILAIGAVVGAILIAVNGSREEVARATGGKMDRECPTLEESDKEKVLARGQSSCEVMHLQRLMNEDLQSYPMLQFSFYPIKEDGIFGSNTLTVLQNLTGKEMISLQEYVETA